MKRVRTPRIIAPALFLPVAIFLCAVSGFANPADSLHKPKKFNFRALMTDTIRFAGYDWTVKDSKGERVGPGTNLFAAKKENVWVDEQGKLHLRITYRNDQWYCPEVNMVQSLGLGKYTFTIDPLPQSLDQDVVIGMFVYDYEDSANFHNEVDVELSVWGVPDNKNAQFVVQPMEDKAHRFDLDLIRTTIHTFEINKKKILFRTAYAPTLADASDKPRIVAEKKFKLSHEFVADSEKVCINAWLFKAIETNNLKEFEVVVAGFRFTPF